MDQSDIYTYESHIFFDDAIIYDDNFSSEPNEFVQNLIQIIDEAIL